MSPVLLRYRGREIGAEATRFIQQLIDQNPGLSRRRLSVELCRAWNWTQANGQWRDMVARSLMLQLHRAGHIRLPDKRMSPPNNVVAKRTPEPTLPLWEQPRQCSLRELGPLEIKPVRRTAAEPLFNTLMEQHHYLGLTTGRGHNATTSRCDQPRKQLWVQPLARDFRRRLQAL